MNCGSRRVIDSANGRNFRRHSWAKPMRLLSILTALVLLTATFAAGAQPAVPQQVDIPSSGGVLHAQLFKPDGTGPFPTVIALHGCGGLNGQSDRIQPRYLDWAEQLL